MASSAPSSSQVVSAAADSVASASAPSSTSAAAPVAPRRAKGWVHFAAGGVGGMCGAIVTSPLDVVKTRLQSDMYIQKKRAIQEPNVGVLRTARNLAWHFVETGHLLGEIATKEGPRALFKGLGPTLVGVIPARSINFYSYGNGKQVLAERFNGGVENTFVHLSAAALAGIITATATNPIWVVKTRLQLESSSEEKRWAEQKRAAVGIRSGSSKPGRPTARGYATAATDSRFFRSKPAPPPPSSTSFAMTMQIIRNEGIPGLYKGMSASYLGVAEGTIQWALYEQLKKWSSPSSDPSLSSTISAAGTAKLVASLITYPHEVIRTRLRQEPEPGQARKYVGLVQTAKVVLRDEGFAALYGGLSAHLLRVVPNAAVMFSIYEVFLHFAPSQ